MPGKSHQEAAGRRVQLRCPIDVALDHRDQGVVIVRASRAGPIARWLVRPLRPPLKQRQRLVIPYRTNANVLGSTPRFGSACVLRIPRRSGRLR